MPHSLTQCRAWRCPELGGPQLLRLENIELAALGADQVRIRTAAFAPGFPDYLMLQGRYQLKPELPFTPCSEFAGEIVACGEDVNGLVPGDPVMASVRFGAASEIVDARADDCIKLAPQADLVAAAAFTVGMKTAYVGLVERGQLEPGETVLIHGAAGGVGLAAVALAKHLGARVIATAGSEKKLAVVRKHGADHVINHTLNGFREEVKALTKGRGADVIYDPVGGDIFDESVRCIAPFGRVLVIGFASGRIPQLAVNYALIKQFSVIGVRAGEFGRIDKRGGARVHQRMAELVTEPALKPYLHTSFPFEQLPAAYEEIAARRVIGRVVVTC